MIKNAYFHSQSYKRNLVESLSYSLNDQMKVIQIVTSFCHQLPFTLTFTHKYLCRYIPMLIVYIYKYIYNKSSNAPTLQIVAIENL